MTVSYDPTTPSAAGASPAGVWLRRWIAAGLLAGAAVLAFGMSDVGAPAFMGAFGSVLFWRWVWEKRNGRRLVVSTLDARWRDRIVAVLLVAALLMLAACGAGLLGEASAGWLVRGPAALALAAVGAWVLQRA